MTELQALVGLAGAPVVAALVSVLVKPFTALKPLYPASALVLGIAWNLALAAVLGQSLPTAAIMGVLSGLAASGAYSAAGTMTGRRDMD